MCVRGYRGVDLTGLKCTAQAAHGPVGPGLCPHHEGGHPDIDTVPLHIPTPGWSYTVPPLFALAWGHHCSAFYPFLHPIAQRLVLCLSVFYLSYFPYACVEDKPKFT